MCVVGPIRGIGKRGNQHAIVSPDHSATHMVKVQMGEEHIGDVFASKSRGLQAAVERMVSVKVIVAEELFTLFVANAAVDEDETVLHLHEK